MNKKLHMIGNAHLDPVWLWRWQDGYEAVRATFRSVLDRMNEYDDFIFTSAAACCYEWVEKSDPGMFEEIRARVQEGRWQLAGGWWIQPDCNLPSGEGFARQALIAQNYFREKFGVTAHTGYNVDSFGHAGTLPKILLMSGMNRYVYMRPGVHERTYPAWTFTWESPEGERVTAFRIPFEYCTWPDTIEAHVNRCADEIADDNGLMCFYGVGNHGGGPTKRNIESIAALNGKNDVSLCFSSPDQFFDSLQKDVRLPVVNGELLHHASGCYAAHSDVKRWNRQAENRLVSAEKWAAAAHMTMGRAYPSAELRKAWKKVLFNQFHDILAGTSIIEAYDDARDDFGYALSVADETSNEALQSMAGQISVPFIEGAQPYVVWNPHGFAAHTPVSIEMADRKGAFRLLDDQGREVPWQKLTASAAARGRSKLTFVADVPAMGWRLYTLAPTEETEQPPAETEESAWVLENETLRASFNPVTGEMDSLFFKPAESEFLRGESSLCCFKDDSDTWSHAKFKFDGEKEPVTLVAMTWAEDGLLCRTLRTVHRIGQSTVTRAYTLYQGVGQVDVAVTVDWQETQKCLKLGWPLKHNYAHARAQAPFGFADREMDGEEYPMHGWVDVSGCTTGMETPLTGLCILNDGKYAYDTHDRTLFITALRSPYYANHEPFVVEEDMDYPVIDHGVQRFKLSLLPHLGAVEGLDRQSALLNAPLTILPEYAHPGAWKGCGSLAQVEGSQVMLDAMKLAEDGGEALVVHLHETCRRACETALTLTTLNKRIPLRFAPGQIRALRISLADGGVTEIDLTEQPVAEKSGKGDRA